MIIKKILSVATAICCMFTLSALPVSADITADVNGDGKVSALDVLLVKKNIFNIIPRTVFEFDLNNDNVVNILDLIIVKSQSLEDSSIDTTTTTTPVVTEPEISEVEKARAVKVDCYDGYNNTREAEEAFLTVLNDYRRANGLGEVWCDFNLDTVEAWKVYFSRRFLRHLDRNNVIMHSVLGSRGVCGTTEIITVQQNSMTVGEALDSFIGSPDHNSALLDPEFNGAGVLITFFEGSSEEGSAYGYSNNNNVFCLVNFCAGCSLGESYRGDNIEDFEAFLSCEIRLDSFDAYCGDAGVEKEENGNRLQEYKIDGMRRAGLIHQWSAEGTRWDGWWNDEVANAANIIFNNFTTYLETGKPTDHGGSMEWTWDEDEILTNYLTAMQYAW